MKKIYNKTALTFEQQCQLIKDRGLGIDNESFVIESLRNIGYYRLSGYWYPFRQRCLSTNQKLDNFIDGVKFADVLFLYEQDKKLRALLLQSIERIEIIARTQISYHFSHKYGAFGYMDKSNFHEKFEHGTWIYKLNIEVERSKDKFIEHYRNTYQNYPNVPVWILTEVMSLGALSHFYKGLKNNQKQGIVDKADIAQYFNVHYKRLESWFHILTYIRNVCAHHSRLWNRQLAIRSDKIRAENWQPPITPRNDRIFYVLLIVLTLIPDDDSSKLWKHQMELLIDEYADKSIRYLRAMGIPENYKEHPLWKPT